MLMQMIKRDNSVMINDIVKHIVRNKEQHAYSIANNLFNKNTPYYTLPLSENDVPSFNILEKHKIR